MKISPRLGPEATTPSALKRPARSVVAVGLVLALGACNLFESELNPREAQVILQSSSGGDMTVIVSNDFVVEGVDEDSDLNIIFITSDTITTGVPFNETYPLAPAFRFFVSVEPSDSTAPPRELTMQVLVDGNERYNKTGSLGEENFEFVYSFN
jgi:hypothetical protein